MNVYECQIRNFFICFDTFRKGRIVDDESRMFLVHYYGKSVGPMHSARECFYGIKCMIGMRIENLSILLWKQEMNK